MSWLLWALGAVILWGFWGIVVKHALSLMDWRVFISISLLGYALPLIVIWTAMRPQSASIGPETAAWAVGAGLISQIALIMLYKALGVGPVSLVVPITALYPALTVLLAILILKESLGASQMVGVVLAVVAGFLLARG